MELLPLSRRQILEQSTLTSEIVSSYNIDFQMFQKGFLPLGRAIEERSCNR